MSDPAAAWLSADEVGARIEPGVDAAALLHGMLPWAASFAEVPVSGFAVGAVAFGLSGAVYAGANLEFAGASLAASVHAEQSAVANAWVHGERRVTMLATSAAPCGHCRQFLSELDGAGTLAVLVRDRAPSTLAELLPSAFGPRDLGVRASLLERQRRPLRAGVDPDDALALAALGAAEESYAPYTRAYAGAALLTADGTIVTGRYAECAAYNPSLPAVQCALSGLMLRRIEARSVTAAVLVEAAGATSQRTAAEALLDAVAGTRLRYVAAGLL